MATGEVESEPATMLRIFATILCLGALLHVCAFAADLPAAELDGPGTLRASTSAGGSALAEEAGAADASSLGGHTSWVGPLVLVFGGLLGGLWLFAGLLSFLRGLSEARPCTEPDELPPYSNRIRNDEAPPTDWL